MSHVPDWDRKDWDAKWPIAQGWDQFTELVATVQDEVLPEAVPLPERFRFNLMADVVTFILRDREMRANLADLIKLADEHEIDKL